MMEVVQFWGTIGIGSVFAVLCWSWIVWPIIKAKWGGSMPTVATTAGDMLSAWADQAQVNAYLAPASAVAKKRGDTVMLGLLKQCRQQAATWDDEVPTVSVAATPTIENIIADAVAKVTEAAK